MSGICDISAEKTGWRPAHQLGYCLESEMRLDPGAFYTNSFETMTITPVRSIRTYPYPVRAYRRSLDIGWFRL